MSTSEELLQQAAVAEVKPHSFSQAAGKDSGKLAGMAPGTLPSADTAALCLLKDELELTAYQSHCS